MLTKDRLPGKSRATLRADLRGKEIFTVGQIAKVCRTANRTVTRWIDSGQLPGYRLPGNSPDVPNEDRRVTRAALVRFLRTHGMPLGPLALDAGTILLVGVDAQLAGKLVTALPRCRFDVAADPFEAGLVLGGQTVHLAVIDLAGQRREAVAMAKVIRSRGWLADMALLAVACEDEADEAELCKAGFAEVLRRPFDEAELVARLQSV